MIILNLFDENFRQSECSVAFAKSRFVRYTRDNMEFDGPTVFTDGYLFNDVVDDVDCPVKIGWLREPRCLWPRHYSDIVEVAGKFDFIMTYDAQLIRRDSKKFIFAPYAGVWIPEGFRGTYDKTSGISMLIGAKKTTEGHRIRHEIVQHVVPDEVDFFGVIGTPVDYSWQTKVRVLSRYHFSIVTETCYELNLFTEILLDCFAVKTIPIFWGCPNLRDFFYADGVLSFRTMRQLENIMNRIRAVGVIETYKKMLWNVEKNFNRCNRYAVTEDWIYRRILKRREDTIPYVDLSADEVYTQI